MYRPKRTLGIKSRVHFPATWADFQWKRPSGPHLKKKGGTNEICTWRGPIQPAAKGYFPLSQKGTCRRIGKKKHMEGGVSLDFAYLANLIGAENSLSE